MSGIELIAEERKRQVEEEGWAPKHDDAHTRGELAGAGACYALHAAGFLEVNIMEGRREATGHKVSLWPWAQSYWKPCGNVHALSADDRIRELTKAGALIAAEIDRLQRAKESEAPK